MTKNIKESWKVEFDEEFPDNEQFNRHDIPAIKNFIINLLSQREKEALAEERKRLAEEIRGKIEENDKEGETLDGFIMNENWDAISKGWGHKIKEKYGELKFANERIHEIFIENQALEQVATLLEEPNH